MDVELIVTSEAQQDIDEAYDWYEARGFGLGDRFLLRVDSCVQNICRHPTSYSIIKGNIRRSLVRQFPYVVFYKYENGQVTIGAICHSSRDSSFIQSRLK